MAVRNDLKLLIFSLATIILAFGLGFLLGTNSSRPGSIGTTNSPDALHQLVTMAKPDFSSAIITYQGVLDQVSPQKIVLVNDQGQTIAFPLDALGALGARLDYQTRPFKTSLPLPTDKSIFTPGVKVTLTIAADVTTGRVLGINLSQGAVT